MKIIHHPVWDVKKGDYIPLSDPNKIKLKKLLQRDIAVSKLIRIISIIAGAVVFGILIGFIPI